MRVLQCACVRAHVCMCARVRVCVCVCVLWMGGAWAARAFSRCRAIRGRCCAAARGSRRRPDPVPARRPRRRAGRHRPDPRAAEAPPAARRPWCGGVCFTLCAAAWDGHADGCLLSVAQGWGAQAAVDLTRRHDRRRFAADGHPLERSDRSSPDCAALARLSRLNRSRRSPRACSHAPPTPMFTHARTRARTHALTGAGSRRRSPTVRGVTMSGVGRRGWRLG